MFEFTLCLQFKGFAVGALIHGGVGFMGSYLNAGQGTIILGAAVMRALAYRTFDGFVGLTWFAAHGNILLRFISFCSFWSGRQAHSYEK